MSSQDETETTDSVASFVDRLKMHKMIKQYKYDKNTGAMTLKIVTQKLGCQTLGPRKSRLSYGDIFTDEKESSGIPIKKVSDGDIIRFFKSKYRPPRDRYTPAKVERRNSKHYTETTKEDAFYGKYDRRQGHLQCGFWSSNLAPYKTVGEVVLEAKDLMWNNLKDTMISHSDPKCKEALNELFKLDGPSPVDSHDKGLDDSGEEIVFYETESGTKMTLNQLRITRHAGRDLVMERLRESEQHLTALFGGQSYADNVRKFQAKIRRAKEAKTSQDRCGMRLCSASIGKPLCKQVLEIDAEEKEAHIRMVERTKELFRKELNFIYVILCSVRNLRSRDLHTKHPLPQSVVQKLRKDPFVRLEELTSRRPRPDLASPRNRPRSQDEHRPSAKLLRNMPSALMETGSHRDSSPSGASRVRSRVSSIHAGQSKRRLLADSGLVETWNDLVNLPVPDQNPPALPAKEFKRWTRRQSRVGSHLGLVKNSRMSSNVGSNPSRLGSCLASKHSRVGCGVGSNKRQLEAKKDVKKPIWNQLGEYQKEKTKVVVQLHQTHKTMKTKRINKMLNSVLSEVMTRNPLESNYIEYLKVKRKLANSAEKKLEVMATDAADVFLDKYKAFNCITPRLPFHSFVKVMEDKVHENSRARHQYKIANQDGEPKWLEFLRNDVETILGFDENLEKLLKLMFRVATSELPWYHTQKVKSIMEDEDILWVLENFSPRGYNPEMFQWWLEHRKVPSWYPFDPLITLVDTDELDKRTDWDIV